MSLLRDLGYHVSGEVWGDASAALGIIHRRGLGKTRHIETLLLWIQQTAAEQRLKYNKVLGKGNPADLYTKFLNAATSNFHTTKLGYIFFKGRSIEAPQLHLMRQSVGEYCNGIDQGLCDWFQVILNKVSRDKYVRKSPQRRSKSLGNLRGVQVAVCKKQHTWNRLNSAGNEKCTADVWQQVLRGSTWQVNLDHPRGSTLTFQDKVGVLYGIGLRHRVTMHRRGRHLRGGMTLLPHGLTNLTAHEQQTSTQPPYNHDSQWRPWCNGIYRGFVSFEKRQPKELYSICRSDKEVTRALSRSSDAHEDAH